jgi:hypothetical protein
MMYGDKWKDPGAPAGVCSLQKLHQLVAVCDMGHTLTDQHVKCGCIKDPIHLIYISDTKQPCHDTAAQHGPETPPQVL